MSSSSAYFREVAIVEEYYLAIAELHCLFQVRGGSEVLSVVNADLSP